VASGRGLRGRQRDGPRRSTGEHCIQNPSAPDTYSGTLGPAAERRSVSRSNNRSGSLEYTSGVEHSRVVEHATNYWSAASAVETTSLTRFREATALARMLRIGANASDRSAWRYDSIRQSPFLFVVSEESSIRRLKHLEQQFPKKFRRWCYDSSRREKRSGASA